jgi:hypothetical protein
MATSTTKLNANWNTKGNYTAKVRSSPLTAAPTTKLAFNFSKPNQVSSQTRKSAKNLYLETPSKLAEKQDVSKLLNSTKLMRNTAKSLGISHQTTETNKYLGRIPTSASAPEQTIESAANTAHTTATGSTAENPIAKTNAAVTATNAAAQQAALSVSQAVNAVQSVTTSTIKPNTYANNKATNVAAVTATNALQKSSSDVSDLLNRLKSLEGILKDMQKIISDAKQGQGQQGGSRRLRRNRNRKGTRRNRVRRRT